MVAPGRAKVCFMQPDLSEPGEFGFTNSWEQANWARNQYDDAIKLLRQFGNEPIPDFQIDYAKGFAEAGLFTNLHLVDLKKSATLLGDAALIDLHAGDVDGAVQNVCSALALTEALKHQKLVISELVRIAMVSNAQYPTCSFCSLNKYRIRICPSCKMHVGAFEIHSSFKDLDYGAVGWRSNVIKRAEIQHRA